MGMIGTFDGFTTARLGIYAAQHGLRVTGNNISNLNTEGYTRQRVNQKSLKVGANDIYRSIYDNHVGNGALVVGINQIRDPYLDIQFRDTNCKLGYTDAWLSGLKDIQSHLDEVGKGMDTNKTEAGDGVLYAQLLDMRDMLMQLHNDPNSGNDTLVRNSAEAMCMLLNSYGKNLDTLWEETNDNYQKELTSVNEILANIRDLNESIRSADICGDSALELRDERNRQIDALSEYMHIKAVYSMEDVGPGKQVEKLTIQLSDDNPDPKSDTDETILISGVYGAQLRSGTPRLNPGFDKTKPNSAANPQFLKRNGEATHKLMDPDLDTLDDYVITVSEMTDSKGRLPVDNSINKGYPVQLEDNDLYGAFQAIRELLTEKGEFATAADIAVDPNAAIKRGIPYYQKSLDLLARQIASAFNELNQGAKVDQNGNVIYEEVDAAGKTVDELGLELFQLKDVNGKPIADQEYYVDVNGCYVGRHGNDCYIREAQLNVSDSLETALKKIASIEADADWDGHDVKQTWGDLVATVLDKDGKIIEGKEDEAQTILENFLGTHAVKKSNGGVDQAGYMQGVDKILVSVPAEGCGPLFSNRNDGDDTTGITARNISVSHSWSTGDVFVVPRYKELFGGDIKDSTQNTNIDRMISRIEQALTYNPKDLDPDAVSDKLFVGSFNDMFSNMQSVLGNNQRSLEVRLNTHYTQLVDIDTSRDGVSGVDLNDEAMNLMTYQKAYSAACRLMTAIDEAIDRLINNTGLVGR